MVDTSMTAPPTGLEPYVPRLLWSWPEDAHALLVEGTLVHMDITGFTAMSERLASKGRVGSEEVAVALTTVFTELLNIAESRGGDLLKFGGDALLLFFTGEGHAVRAAAVAAEMRTALRTVGRIETPAGVVRLEMTVGLHTDAFTLFMTGDTHRELLVTGPAATITVAMEEGADPGEILLSPATAAALDPSVLGDVKDGGVLLRRAPGDVPDAPASPRAPDPTSLERYLPPSLRDVVGRAAGRGEHRRATLAFVEFTGVDSRLGREGTDAVAAWLDELVKTVQAAVAEFGVAFLASDIDRDGGKLILSAGVPNATGNDDERMLMTVRRIADSPIGGDVKIGVNRGAIFAGDIGSPTRRVYTTIGDGVNLAARVMAKAGPGCVVTTLGALERSGTIFAAEQLEPFMVKGKSEPVHAAVLGQPEGSRETVDTDDVPFVDRHAELEALIEAFTSANGRGSLIEIVGQAGVGKSRLVGEARARTVEEAWFKSSSEQYEQSNPYASFRKLLRSILSGGTTPPAGSEQWAQLITDAASRVGGEVPQWAPLIAAVLDIEMAPTPESRRLDPKFVKERTHQAVIDLLAGLRPDRTAFVFDNAQWMDDVSGELVEKLADQANRRPWVVCLLKRPEEAPYAIEGGTTIELGPLDADASHQLARAVTESQPVPEPLIHQAIQRSGGNPFFLLEMLRSGASGEDLPASIEDLVAARIDALDVDLRQIVRYGAVCGRSFDLELLDAVVGAEVPAVRDEATWDRLAELIERRGNGTLRFRQNLFRDVAYTGLPYRVRSELHARVGAAIERRSPDPMAEAELLSLHFSLAGDATKTWQYATHAAQRARREYANLEAAEFYRRAIDAARDLDGLTESDLAAVAEGMGDAYEVAGLYAEADHAYGLARDFTSDRRAQARIFGKQGLLREKAGKLPQALSWFTRGLRLLRDDDHVLRADLLINHAGVRFRQGKFAETVTYAEQALELLDGIEAGDEQRAHAYSLLVLAYSHLDEGDATAVAAPALEIYDRLDDLIGQAAVLNNLGIDAYYRGRWEEARERWSQANEASERAGDVVGAATALNNIAEILLDQGHLEEAGDTFAEAHRIWRGAGYHVGTAVAALNLGRTAGRLGRIDDARMALETAREKFERMGAKSYVNETILRLAELEVMRGAGEAAEALLAEVADLTTPQRAIRDRLAAHIAFQRGDAEAATETLTRAREEAEASGSRLEAMLCLEALARFGADVDMRPATETVEGLGIVAVPTPWVMAS